MNKDMTTAPWEDPGAKGAASESIEALPFPRTTLANNQIGEAPNVWPEAGDLPSDDDRLKRSRMGRSSTAPLEGMRDDEKAVTSGLRAAWGCGDVRVERDLDKEGPTVEVVAPAVGWLGWVGWCDIFSDTNTLESHTTIVFLQLARANLDWYGLWSDHVSIIVKYSPSSSQFFLFV
jgi:hypothetical protein